MPIEIKELIIRTSVEKGPSPNQNDLSMEKLVALKKEIMKDCEQLIAKTIKKQNSR